MPPNPTTNQSSNKPKGLEPAHLHHTALRRRVDTQLPALAGLTSVWLGHETWMPPVANDTHQATPDRHAGKAKAPQTTGLP